jgi:hypothetical protein
MRSRQLQQLLSFLPPLLRPAAGLCALMGIGRAVYEWLITAQAQPAALAAGGGYLLLAVTLQPHRPRTTAAVAGLLTAAALGATLGMFPVSLPLWDRLGSGYGGFPLITAAAALAWGLLAAAPSDAGGVDQSAVNQ